MHECIRKLRFNFMNGMSLILVSKTKEKQIDNCITRLRKLMLSCGFGTITDELICDRLVIGLVDIHECCFTSSRQMILSLFISCFLATSWNSYFPL